LLLDIVRYAIVSSAKSLTVDVSLDSFTNKLQWDQHIHCITSKANKTLGFLRKNLKIPSIRIKEQAYFTQVRYCVVGKESYFDVSLDWRSFM
jgi:hypothetical protein